MALQKLNVERQAYQGGTFVGNHVHKLLQVHMRYALYYTIYILYRTRKLRFWWGTLRKRAESTYLQLFLWLKTPVTGLEGH